MDFYYGDDDGFEGYVPTTRDPGGWMMGSVVIYSLTCFLILPPLVVLGNRWERFRKQSKEDKTSDNNNGHPPFVVTVGTDETFDLEQESSETKGIQLTLTKSKSDESEHGDSKIPSRHHTSIPNANHISLQTKTDLSENESQSYNISYHTCNSKDSHKSHQQSKINISNLQSDTFDQFDCNPSYHTCLPEITNNKSQRNVYDLTNKKCGEEMNSRKTTKFNKLILNEDISPEDAIDADDKGLEHAYIDEDEVELTICCGPKTLFSRRTFSRSIDQIYKIADPDSETKRIVKLGIPLTISGLAKALFYAVKVALVGQYLGTDQLTAYTVADLLIGLSDTLVRGIPNSLNTLCSHAIGADNKHLAGQYIQISCWVYLFIGTPLLGMWWFIMDDLIGVLGLSERIQYLGSQYVRFGTVYYIIDGLEETFMAFLDVTDHYVFGTIIDVVEAAITPLIIWLFIANVEGMNLFYIGLIEFVVSTISILFSIWFAFYKGWMDGYTEGMFKSFALRNWRAVKATLKTAIPLSFGELLAYGEWSVLTFFVAYLGPAEVAAWGLLGSIWDLFEAATEGFYEACGIRVSHYLGKGNADMAKLASYKSLFISLILGIFTTSIFFMCGQDLAKWFTKDPTLQSQLNEAMPLMGFGNILLVFGMSCWSLVGAQGKFHLATIINILSSFIITLPLSALFCYQYRFDLKGVVGAVIIGYSTVGLALSYCLFRSDWPTVAKYIQEYNFVHGIEDSESDDDDSSSSSSSKSDDGISVGSTLV